MSKEETEKALKVPEAQRRISRNTQSVVAPSKKTFGEGWSQNLLRNFSVLVMFGMLLAAHVVLTSAGQDGLSAATSETLWAIGIGGLLGQAAERGAQERLSGQQQFMAEQRYLQAQQLQPMREEAAEVPRDEYYEAYGMN